MNVRLGLIVEGQGDVLAAPVLLRRLAAELDPPVRLDIGQPYRLQRSRLSRKDELERAARLLAARLEGRGGILLLMDADDDCPRDLAPEVLARLRGACPGVPCAVVLAVTEYEAWFVAASQSLVERGRLRADTEFAEHPETIRGAKEWLRRYSPAGRTYSETVDQPAFSALIDLSEASKAPSFAKLRRDLEGLVTAVRRLCDA